MKLISYASGNGALSFVYCLDNPQRTACGSPQTIGEVANSDAWKEIERNIANFDHILQNFGSEKFPEILAFGPVRRVSENTLRAYAYGEVTDYEYRPGVAPWAWDFTFKTAPDVAEIIGERAELKNLSIKGALSFFLAHEEKCTEALELRDQRERAQGKPHLIPPVCHDYTI